MIDSMTYPHTTSHISLKISSVVKPSHNIMVRSTEERFATERMATRGFGSKKIAAALGVPEATTKRWLRRLRSDSDMASRNIGRPRGVEAGVCLVSCYLSHIARIVLCASSAPSHASRLACELYQTVLHGTVEFQPLCSPDLSSCDFFSWNELKVLLVQHPAPHHPAELRALLTRVYHRTWAGSREMFEKIGNAWVRKLKACVAAKSGFLE